MGKHKFRIKIVAQATVCILSQKTPNFSEKIFLNHNIGPTYLNTNHSNIAIPLQLKCQQCFEIEQFAML
jgi:hypothetical protein